MAEWFNVISDIKVQLELKGKKKMCMVDQYGTDY